jgi:hypothetical protein
MSETDSAPTGREEIEMLLPWYVTGRIDAADRAKVEAWIARDPGLARQLEIIKDERHAVAIAAEAIQLPRHMSAQSMLATIPERPAGMAGVMAWLTGGIDRTIASFSPAGLRWAAAAAVLLIVMQAAGIGVLLRDSTPGTGYHSASGPTLPSASGTFVLVKPAGTATVVAMTAVLSEIGATIEGGPTADGIYRIRIGDAALAEPRRKAALERLRAERSLFQLVLPEPQKRPAP